VQVYRWKRSSCVHTASCLGAHLCTGIVFVTGKQLCGMRPTHHDGLGREVCACPFLGQPSVLPFSVTAVQAPVVTRVFLHKGVAMQNSPTTPMSCPQTHIQQLVAGRRCAQVGCVEAKPQGVSIARCLLASTWCWRHRVQ
jgi:hypothetical protein